MFAKVRIIGDGTRGNYYRPDVAGLVDQWQAVIPTDAGGHPKHADCLISVPDWRPTGALVPFALSPQGADALLRARDPKLRLTDLVERPPKLDIRAAGRYQLGQDLFTRADNADIGASWDAGYTGMTAGQIVGGKVRGTVITTQEFDESYNALTLPADCWTEATLTITATAVVKYAWVFARCTAPATLTGYQATIARNDGAFTSAIEKRVSGTGTQLSSENAITWATGDTWRLEVEGSAIRMYRNNGQILSASDSAISAAGRAGMGCYVASGSVGELEIDDIAFGGFSVSVATPRGSTRAIERAIERGIGGS